MSSSVKSTGMAEGWSDCIIAFASAVRMLNRRCSPSSLPLKPVHGRQIPANAKGGRSGSRANQYGTFGWSPEYSQKLVAGTTQRYAGVSHDRQNVLLVF